MKITCIDKEMKAVLESGFYKVPRFQRPYSWEKENVEEFWNDTIVEGDIDYFIGSMVVYKLGSLFGIVDGQQRLTTITMILCALRNRLAHLGFSDLAQGIHNLVERRDINNIPQFVLQTETSYPYLQEYIQKNGTPDVPATAGEEETCLKEAFSFINSRIDELVAAVQSDPTMTADARTERLKESLSQLRDRVLHLTVIFIELEKEDDAYMIFETLNTRGKDLTVSDLVKNHLTRLIRPTNLNVDTLKDKWNSMVTLLQESQADLDPNRFLLHFWLSRYQYVTEKKLFKVIRKEIRRNNAREFLDTLGREAKIYREMAEPSFRKWKKAEYGLRDSLEAMSLFGISQHIPFVLSVLREYHANGLNLKHADAVLSSVENFHFQFTAVTSQRSSGGISMMYALHARELQRGDDLQRKIKVIRSIVDKLKARTPSYAEFLALFQELKYSQHYTRQKKLVHYVLSRLDSHNAQGARLDYQQMTIEHIAPQSGNLAEESIAKIGNLILVDQTMNNKLGTKPFGEKKKVLCSSRMWVDDKIRNASKWGKEEIDDRTEVMAKLAYERVWKV